MKIRPVEAGVSILRDGRTKGQISRQAGTQTDMTRPKDAFLSYA